MCYELAVNNWEWDLRFIIVIPWKHQLSVQYWSTLSIVYGSCPCLQNIWLNFLNCGRIEKGSKDAQRSGVVSMHRMTEQHRDNLGCGTGLIKLSCMELPLNKKNCFLTQQIAGTGTQCKDCKLFYISSRGDYARESHWDLPNTQKTPGFGKFLVEKYVNLVKIVGGNTMYVSAAPVLLLVTTYDCFGR